LWLYDRKKCEKAGALIEPLIFSEMGAYTGLPQFCIRYTKTCQGNYPSSLWGFLPYLEVVSKPQIRQQALSKEAVTLTVKVVQKGAAIANFNDALEIGYKGFREIACTEAAKEGISAFLQKRPPNFTK
jgi:enoyl-CoA hydratase/3-hydroxyacyl-CoA dehydrogenase